MGKRPRIAIVDVDAEATRTLGSYLLDLGYDVETTASLTVCERLVEGARADLLVLDSRLAEDGGNLLQRAAAAGIPVVVLSRDHDPVERVVGLERGAADVLDKPVDPQELAARVANVLGRHGLGRREVVRFESSTVDMTASRLLQIGQTPERLGPGEIMLVRAFATRPNQILSREDLMDLAPAESLDANDRSIDTRIARLRRKIGTEAIVTIRGRGYMFVPPSARPA